ncbi:MAG: biopolymer transporter ExbD [Candidatus Magnetomorum sp.]|nr:biopolymer transporter ExbD [Candidatus Magnetomorum sp.]
MALGQRRYQKKSFVIPKLQITSMMDMFTIILIFLLFSFSDNPEKLHIDKGLVLPKSASQMDCEKNITVSLSLDCLKIGDEHIANIHQGIIQGFDSQYPEHSTLYKKLIAVRHDLEQTNADEKLSINIFCDHRLPYKTIHQVIKISGMAGFPHFQFAVLKNQEGGAL